MEEVRRPRPQRTKSSANRQRPRNQDNFQPDNKCTRCGKIKHKPGDMSCQDSNLSHVHKERSLQCTIFFKDCGSCYPRGRLPAWCSLSWSSDSREWARALAQAPYELPERQSNSNWTLKWRWQLCRKLYTYQMLGWVNLQKATKPYEVQQVNPWEGHWSWPGVVRNFRL